MIRLCLADFAYHIGNWFCICYVENCVWHLLQFASTVVSCICYRLTEKKGWYLWATCPRWLLWNNS